MTSTVDHANLHRLEAQSRRDHQAAQQTLATSARPPTVAEVQALADQCRNLQARVTQEVDRAAANPARLAALLLDDLASTLGHL